ncbi:integrase, catalytic region, zinc finger, CCHC-type containing protein [Tanacetum coccineum]
MFFKVEFEKAFESIRWDYLQDILKMFGFGDKWCGWIFVCLNSAMGSVLVNGSPTSEFQFHKGLFLGIPIDSSLTLSHLFFADDAIFIGIGTRPEEVNAATTTMGCSIFTTPFVHLGVKVGEATSECSVKSVRQLIDDSKLPKEEVATRWVKVMPIKINVFAWRVRLDKLPTRLNLSLKGIDISTIVCPLCHASIESGSHIFFSCPMARHLWRILMHWWELGDIDLASYDDWLLWLNSSRISKQLKEILECVCYVQWWLIWRVRNWLLFGATNLHCYFKIQRKQKYLQELAPKYYGPFKILARIGQVAYKLDLQVLKYIQFFMCPNSQFNKFKGDGPQFPAMLPQCDCNGLIDMAPFVVLDKRMAKRGNATTVYVLFEYLFFVLELLLVKKLIFDSFSESWKIISWSGGGARGSSDTRPPMLDRTDFASWQQCIRLYCRGKDNGVNILKLPNDIYILINYYTDAKDIWDNVKMLLEGLELTKEDRESQLYDDFEHFRQHKGETIHDYYGRFVASVKLNRGLRDSNYDQLYAYLKQHEAHANENKMMLDRFTQHIVDPLAWMSNVAPQVDRIEVKQDRLSATTATNEVALDEEQLLFLAGGQDNAVDEDVDEQPVHDLALNVDNVFQADDCDAFDCDVDEAPTAQTMFMANLSSADPDYDEASPSYDSDILSMVHDHDHYQDDVCEHHEVHEMHDNVQPNYVVDSHADYTSNSNIISYDQHVKENAVPVIQSNVSSVPNDAYMMMLNDIYEPSAKCVSVTTQNNVIDNSLTAELATYKKQVELYGRQAKFELTKREQKIVEQLRIVITDRNIC